MSETSLSLWNIDPEAERWSPAPVGRGRVEPTVGEWKRCQRAPHVQHVMGAHHQQVGRLSNKSNA